MDYSSRQRRLAIDAASAGELAESVNGALSYLLADGLGSVSEAIATSGTGSVSAAQLYGPYGAVRYLSGTLPTSKGYTGQRSDASTSGLDYYGARYYDPVAGQFTSADPLSSVGLATLVYGGQVSAGVSTPDSSAQLPAPRDGLNAYLYVRGDPETDTDPTGLWTVGICVSVGAGIGIGGFLQGCAVLGHSDDGRWTGGLSGTYGGGVSAGAEVQGGIGIQISNAQQVSDLGGPFDFAGGTIADGFGPGVIGFTGQDSHGQQVTGADIQVVAGAGAAGYGGSSQTGVLESIGPDIHVTPAQQRYLALHGPSAPVSDPSLHAWARTTQTFGRYRRSFAQVFHRVNASWERLTEHGILDPERAWSHFAPWLPSSRWLH